MIDGCFTFWKQTKHVISENIMNYFLEEAFLGNNFMSTNARYWSRHTLDTCSNIMASTGKVHVTVSMGLLN